MECCFIVINWTILSITYFYIDFFLLIAQIVCVVTSLVYTIIRDFVYWRKLTLKMEHHKRIRPFLHTKYCYYVIGIFSKIIKSVLIIVTNITSAEGFFKHWKLLFNKRKQVHLWKQFMKHVRPGQRSLYRNEVRYIVNRPINCAQLSNKYGGLLKLYIQACWNNPMHAFKNMRMHTWMLKQA